MSVSSSAAQRRLQSAGLKALGRLRSASNVVLLCSVDASSSGGSGLRPALTSPDGRGELTGVGRLHDEELCVYKPVRGERPLWDFPNGSLAGREFASYLISEALGWSLIPPTALREGPYGWGMAQQWVHPLEGADELVGFFLRAQVPRGWRVVLTGEDEGEEEVALAHADHPRLRQLAVLDVLLNNADRKGGHVLLGDDGMWGIDHGVCLHEDPKLRTVLWGWAGEDVPVDQLADVGRLSVQLDGPLGEELAEHLTTEELVALAERAQQLLVDQVMPSPRGSRVLPWPLM